MAFMDIVVVVYLPPLLPPQNEKEKRTGYVFCGGFSFFSLFMNGVGWGMDLPQMRRAREVLYSK